MKRIWILFIAAITALAACAAAAQTDLAAPGKSIGDTLALSGGYGLAGMFVLALVAQARKIDALHERTLGLVTKMTEVLVEHNLNTKRTIEILDDIRERDH